MRDQPVERGISIPRSEQLFFLTSTEAKLRDSGSRLRTLKDTIGTLRHPDKDEEIWNTEKTEATAEDWQNLQRIIRERINEIGTSWLLKKCATGFESLFSKPRKETLYLCVPEDKTQLTRFTPFFGWMEAGKAPFILNILLQAEAIRTSEISEGTPTVKFVERSMLLQEVDEVKTWKQRGIMYGRKLQEKFPLNLPGRHRFFNRPDVFTMNTLGPLIPDPWDHAPPKKEHTF